MKEDVHSRMLCLSSDPTSPSQRWKVHSDVGNKEHDEKEQVEVEKHDHLSYYIYQEVNTFFLGI